MSMSRQAGIVLPGYNALKVANAPTIGTATAGSSGCVSVAFTAPSCTGGSVISTYSAYCTTTGTSRVTGASSPIVVTGLTIGTSYTFRVVATNIYGPSYPSAASNSATPVAVGQQAYTSSGTYTWVAPTGVTSVSVVAVGAGGGAASGNCSGGGGALAYKNNISVTPGSSYTVNVGAGACQANGGNSRFPIGGGLLLTAGGGFTRTCCQGGAGGTFSNADGGGNGGAAGVNTGAGGGAGGYTGAGGRGTNSYGTAGVTGSGGGAGGGGAFQQGCNTFRYAGGGVGILGAGSNGAGGANAAGGGGSGGTSGGNPAPRAPGVYGGGAGGAGSGCYPGAVGAVRIIWPGTTRSFPSTCTGNL